MTRAVKGTVSKKRHKKVLKLAKGYRGRSKNCFRVAIQRVEKALQYAYRDRRNKKRDFRKLWIQRINAAARLSGLTYSQFINGIKLAGIEIDRKVLAELAVSEPDSFAQIAQKAVAAIEANKKAA
ncbi:50S ribosomal protein L20 [Rickettsiales bacterium]|nr:50S ribosomal protein L20 [Rickettsiales bacterium]